MENIKSKIIETIENICEKYQDDPYMIYKTENFICNQLPIILQTIEKNHAERVQRIEDMTIEQDSFMQSFLSNNRYFYAPSTENFFYYDGVHYLNITEDAVLYNILSSISRDRQLMSWKYKTKVAIMKRIRENHVHSCIPESSTIQSVLNVLCPTIFSTKNEAKYFLTILGDNIMKKNELLIHIMDHSAKLFINNLNSVCQIWFGVNLNQSFKYKYHADHLYSNVRLLSVSDNVFNNEENKTWMHGSIGLNLLFVACHYSNRYINSDNYVSKYSNDDKLIDKTFYLKNISQETLISIFIGEYMTTSSSHNRESSQITWKNMLYLWKHFLEAKQLPNVVNSTKLKTFITQQMEAQYDKETDVFVGISSKYLPTVCQFLQFWEETMIPDESELELEIGELATLFKKWSENNISEKQIINILSYFFPEIEIDQEKYIYKMRSKIWDKQIDIMISMDDLKDKSGGQMVSAYDAYVYYCNYMNGTATGTDADGNVKHKRRPSSGTLTAVPLLVSKQYFDKYMAFA
jgi:hypothetical protein